MAMASAAGRGLRVVARGGPVLNRQAAEHDLSRCSVDVAIVVALAICIVMSKRIVVSIATENFEFESVFVAIALAIAVDQWVHFKLSKKRLAMKHQQSTASHMARQSQQHKK